MSAPEIAVASQKSRFCAANSPSVRQLALSDQVIWFTMHLHEGEVKIVRLSGSASVGLVNGK